MAERKLVKDLSDQEILRVARVRVSETAANTYTQVELDTQLSIERGVIWMIHFIEIMYGSPLRWSEVGPNLFEQTSLQVVRETKTNIVNGNDSDLLQMFQRVLCRSPAIGTDAGPLYYLTNTVDKTTFPVPLPYASQSMFFGLRTTHSSLTSVVDIRVGYTLREVTDKFFFRVAQALLG